MLKPANLKAVPIARHKSTQAPSVRSVKDRCVDLVLADRPPLPILRPPFLRALPLPPAYSTPRLPGLPARAPGAGFVRRLPYGSDLSLAVVVSCLIRTLRV